MTTRRLKGLVKEAAGSGGGDQRACKCEGDTVSGVRSMIGTDEQKQMELLRRSLRRERASRDVPWIRWRGRTVLRLKRGKQDALILRISMEMGAVAVKTASDCMREKKVEKRINLQWHVLTKAECGFRGECGVVESAGGDLFEGIVGPGRKYGTMRGSDWVLVAGIVCHENAVFDYTIFRAPGE